MARLRQKTLGASGGLGKDAAFSDVYSRLTRPACIVRERTSPENFSENEPIREKVVRCLWFDQFLDHGDLRTEDGQRLSVFFPGHWNEGAGPDFKNAEFSIGNGARERADVEIHVCASDWNRHGHARDSAYARVGLHVVLHNDVCTPTISHDSKLIPQFALENQLSEDLDKIVKTLDSDGYPNIGCGREGACCRSIRAYGRDEQWIGWFLDIAGDARILTKAGRYAANMETSPPDEVLYKALMDAMGYRNNRRGFRMLAECAPLDDLRKLVPVDGTVADRQLSVQAILFGAGGFLGPETSDVSDKNSEGYVKRLGEQWEVLSRDLSLADTADCSWNFKGTRPTNHPIRRIAAISRFLASHLHAGLCRALLMALEGAGEGQSELVRCRRVAESLLSLFNEPAEGYWTRRTAFGPPRLKRNTRLIGSDRATDIIVNVAIPVLLALSRERGDVHTEQRLHNIYVSFKPKNENSITKYMNKRIFGNDERASRVVATLRRQQALHQIFHDFCESSTTTCDECGFLSAVEGRTA